MFKRKSERKQAVGIDDPTRYDREHSQNRDKVYNRTERKANVANESSDDDLEEFNFEGAPHEHAIEETVMSEKDRKAHRKQAKKALKDAKKAAKDDSKNQKLSWLMRSMGLDKPLGEDTAGAADGDQSDQVPEEALDDTQDTDWCQLNSPPVPTSPLQIPSGEPSDLSVHDKKIIIDEFHRMEAAMGAKKATKRLFKNLKKGRFPSTIERAECEDQPWEDDLSLEEEKCIADEFLALQRSMECHAERKAEKKADKKALKAAIKDSDKPPAPAPAPAPAAALAAPSSRPSSQKATKKATKQQQASSSSSSSSSSENDSPDEEEEELVAALACLPLTTAAQIRRRQYNAPDLAQAREELRRALDHLRYSQTMVRQARQFLRLAYTGYTQPEQFADDYMRELWSEDGNYGSNRMVRGRGRSLRGWMFG